jgi:hypothetical protein
MKPINYTNLSDPELDRLAAEKFSNVFQDGVGQDVVNFDGRMFEVRKGHFKDYPMWQPTHPESNQVERYLFPKLKDLHCFIDTHDDWMECYEIKILTWPKMEGEVVHPILLGKAGTTDQDQINRTKLIACLEAWEKLQ